MTETPPQTGDPVVDEVLQDLQASAEAPLAERAEAAAGAQRRLQERLSTSAPRGDTPPEGNRPAGGPRGA